MRISTFRLCSDRAILSPTSDSRAWADVLTSSEADQRSPLLRSIDRPSAREGRQAAKGAKESSRRLQGVEEREGKHFSISVR
jgi:hypothetical protein